MLIWPKELLSIFLILIDLLTSQLLCYIKLSINMVGILLISEGRNSWIWAPRSPDKETLLKREQYYLDTFKPHYNIHMTAGSPLGFNHSEKTKKTLRSSRRDDGNPIHGKKGPFCEGKQPELPAPLGPVHPDGEPNYQKLRFLKWKKILELPIGAKRLLALWKFWLYDIHSQKKFFYGF